VMPQAAGQDSDDARLMSRCQAAERDVTWPPRLPLDMTWCIRGPAQSSKHVEFGGAGI
jgi:hypothetical protein